MTNATSSYIEIDRAHWNQVLKNITQDYRGAHVKLEVIGPDLGYQVQTENRPFDGIAADNKDGESIVWISLTPPSLTHGVHGTRAIRWVPATSTAEAVVEIEASDGTRTILTLDSPERHALPEA